MSRFANQFAALLRGTGAAKKQPGLSTELKELNMQTVLDRIIPIIPKKQPDAGTVHWLNECVARGEREVFTEHVTITPGLASELLKRNPGNRLLSERKIANYARDMINGCWVLNGETIIISTTGELNNGQHRLSAIIEANRPVEALLAFGLTRASRLTVDQGMARSAAHYLAMQGVENTKACASIAGILIAIERSSGAFVKADTTHQEVTTRVLNDPAIGRAAHFSATVQRFAKAFLTPSQIGSLYYLFDELSTADADKYMRQVCLGESIKRGDPAFSVRQALGGLKGEQRQVRMEITMRGWVAIRQRRTLKLAKTLGVFPALV